MKTKKYVLVLGAIGATYLGVLILLSMTRCYDNEICSNFFTQFRPWNFGMYLFFTPALLLLSLITYKMRDEVFRAWWRFARWWVPVIIVVTLLLENAGGGGTLGMNKDFTAFILIILYSILIITSLVKIVRAYQKTN